MDDKRALAREALNLHQTQPYALGPMLLAARRCDAAGHPHTAAEVCAAFALRYGADPRAGEALRLLASGAPVVAAGDGAAVVREGDASDALYVVFAGTVEVRRHGAGTLATLGPGHAFGEIALLARTPRTATVAARGGAELLEVSRHNVVELARFFPPLQGILAAVYRERLLAQLIPPGSCFATLDAERRHTLFAQFVPGSVAAGTPVLREGQEGVGFFVIMSGRARVWQRDLNHRPETRAELGPGDFFGELSLLNEMPVNATVEAIEPLTFLSLRRDRFHEVMKSHPEEIQRVLAVAQRRLGFQRAGAQVDFGQWNAGGEPGDGPGASGRALSLGGMTCPRCGFDQDEGLTCVACGANVARERARRGQGLPGEMPSFEA